MEDKLNEKDYQDCMLFFDYHHDLLHDPVTVFLTYIEDGMIKYGQFQLEVLEKENSQFGSYRIRSLEQTDSIPHDNNHINVLWMNRSLSAYCDSVGGEHTTSGTVAFQGEGIPIYTVTGIQNVNSIEAYEAIMGLTLAHEIAHLYGLDDQYKNNEPFHCWDAEGNPIYCCMNYAYYNGGVRDFYDAVAAGDENIFCPSCHELMADNKVLFHKNNFSD